MPILNDEVFVDPDPIAIASLALAAGAFVVQLADYFRKSPSEGSRPIRPISDSARQTLSKLEESLEDVEKTFRNVIRAAERGSQDVEAELYAAPMRMGQVQLLLSKQAHQEFSRSLMEAFSKTGTLGMWIATVMSNQPEISHFIGGELEHRARESAEKFNQILAEGRPIRDILSEANMLVRTLREIVTRLVDGN